MSAQTYRQRLYRVPAEHGEALAAWLWGEGALGLQELAEVEGEARIEAYFDPDTEPDEPPPGLGARLVDTDERPVVDWLETYRRLARPLEIGRRFVIDPREIDPQGAGAGATGDEPPTAPDRIRLRIPARSAFGTGSHESTRLVLELLEDLPLTGRRVLDVGTGSGILAFAALALGARSAAAFDIDLESVLLAGQNGRLNDPPGERSWPPAFFAGGIEVLRPGASFDVALVNILPERMLPFIHRLPPLLEEGATVLFSGILDEVAPPVLERLGELGFAAVASRHAGEWVGYRCRYSAPGAP
ncbi:MAG: 50S ribosomal protein L11 methyltransferase [Acidobacteria bacterium]|nr:50S ribosomal protein L11 methyltransferase [Acidobacteriota bacterium]